MVKPFEQTHDTLYTDSVRSLVAKLGIQIVPIRAVSQASAASRVGGYPPRSENNLPHRKQRDTVLRDPLTPGWLPGAAVISRLCSGRDPPNQAMTGKRESPTMRKFCQYLHINHMRWLFWPL